MTTVVILQSNYIPWKGYFDLINDSDVFIFYDDVQFTKNDWRNRNKIKTPRGSEWISVPVGSDIRRLICEVEINNSTWQVKHWSTIRQNYAGCPYFSHYVDLFEYVYLRCSWKSLSALNKFLIRVISSDLLGVSAKFLDSQQFRVSGSGQDRLLSLLVEAGATRYVSGPAAKTYINPSDFADHGIDLVWKNYTGYPEYPQRNPPFAHQVSILDLLFNVGPNAPWYIWGWRQGGSSPR